MVQVAAIYLETHTSLCLHASVHSLVKVSCESISEFDLSLNLLMVSEKGMHDGSTGGESISQFDCL
jgi:hypothetical protein